MEKLIAGVDDQKITSGTAHCQATTRPDFTKEGTYADV
jgi:hypothetical protein